MYKHWVHVLTRCSKRMGCYSDMSNFGQDSSDQFMPPDGEGTARVKCLAPEHNMMFPSRA